MLRRADKEKASLIVKKTFYMYNHSKKELAIYMNRITDEDALGLIQNGDLKELGILASQIKERLHPDKITTFVVDRNINYTNICWVDCKFCAFYRHADDEDAYILTYDEIDSKIDELLEIIKRGQATLIKRGQATLSK